MAKEKKQSKKKGNGHAPTHEKDTLIGVVLDRSGSMASCREGTITGFNEYVRELRKQPGVALMSLTQFDDHYEPNFTGVHLEAIPDMDCGSYIPRGSTALHDAIAKMIHDTGEWVTEKKWEGRVLMLIITDGMENASKEHNLHDVQRLIKEKEAAGWNFAYMGSNQDSYAVGIKMGMRRGFTHNYESKTSGGMHANYVVMAGATNAYRGGSARGMSVGDFFDPNDPANQPGGAGAGVSQPLPLSTSMPTEGTGKLEPKGA